MVLGAGIMQGPALTIAAEMGLLAVAADADEKAACVNLAGRFEKVDLKDREGIETLARSLAEDAENGGLSGIMTAGTDFSANVAWAAGKLGLPGTSYESALNASDKERMRERFKEAGVPSPEFVIMKAVPEAGSDLPFSWPAVVKPVDNMGSRGCRRVDNFSELKAAVAEALKFSRGGRAIVEEYMEGPEFSVDALVYKGEITICGFADRHIFFPPYFIEMGHTMPSCRDSGVIQSLLDAFCRGVKALGITNSAAKGDIKMTPKGPMIGEIAARLSGGYMSGWTYPYSSGVLPTRGAIEIALGKKPTRLQPDWKWTSAERAFTSIPGKVRSIDGVEKARAMPFIKNVFMRAKTGSTVSFPENNVSKCGNIISAAAAREEAILAAENAARSILIRLEAPNEETDSFLSGFCDPTEKTVFPPDAFNIDSRLFGLLSALPESHKLDFSSHPRTECRSAETQREIRKQGAGGPHSPSPIPHSLIPFPEFTESGLKDYMGRSIEECLCAVRLLTGMELPPGNPNGNLAEENTSVLGRSFWKAFIRGGYQGAVYYIDSLKAGND